MKYLLLITVLAFPLSLFAQEEKGAKPHPPLEKEKKGVTRAVVVGISDYQDKDIPDLRFADRDAEAFANFLRSPGGGALSSENMRVLTNQNATVGQVIAALTWLLDESHEGDQAIIYFSGHGDVENKLLNQLGFLLLWDSPARVYLAGALPVDMLRQVVSTLSIELKTKVFVVVDACRAGKLAGNTVIGTHLTSNQLAQQFSHEQKILSCQPNEYSIEGEQWGGGRGVFSYYLIKGLYGLADADKNGNVTLFEIGRYLEDHVPKDVSPLSQLPITVGDKGAMLFSVNDKVLATLEKRGVEPVILAAVEQRGMLHETLAKMDSTVRFWYAGFERTLRAKQFFEPAGNCAEYYFNRLMGVEDIAAFRPMFRRNYAAALQDDAQQVTNKILKTDIRELMLSKKTAKEKYEVYPRHVEKAAELLGEDHYMYPILQARKLFFEGYLLSLPIAGSSNRSVGWQALEKFRAALLWQPDMSEVFLGMSFVFGNTLIQLDSAEYYAQLAASLSPTWVLPFSRTAVLFERNGQSEKARAYLEKADQLDSSSSALAISWGSFYNGKGLYAEAEQQYKKAIRLDSTNTFAHNNLGYLYQRTRRYTEAEQQYKKTIQLDSTFDKAYTNLGNLLNQAQRYPEAEQYFKKALQLDSTSKNAFYELGRLYGKTGRFAETEVQMKKALQLDSAFVSVYVYLGYLYQETRRYPEAEQYFKKAIQLDSTNIVSYTGLATVYGQVKRYAEAEQQLNKTIQLDSISPLNYYNLSCFQSLQNQVDKAYETLEQAIKKGYNNFDSLQKDIALAPLRALPEWKELMKKYFPDNVKD